MNPEIVKAIAAAYPAELDSPEAESAARACERILAYDGPKGTFLDLGAHRGGVSLFAKLAGFDRVVSYEPCGWHFKALLALRDAHSDLKKWYTFPEAVYWRRGGETLRRGVNSGQVSLTFSRGRPNLHAVKCVKLYQDVVKPLGFVDYLKFDIEGSEYPIFTMDEEAKKIWPLVRYVDFERHGTTHELLAGGFPKDMPSDASERLDEMLAGLGLEIIDAMHARGYVRSPV